MEKSRLAVCIIAYNEEKNIRQLLESIIGEKIKGIEIFVCSEGSTDKTGAIVGDIEHKYPKLIRHIRGETRQSKHLAHNSLLKRIQGYKYACFMDGDIKLTKGAISKLKRCFKENPKIKVIAPLTIPLKSNSSIVSNEITKIYRKVKAIIARASRYRYFTGRCYFANTADLPLIPNENYTDDFYLNLQFEPKEIGYCTEAAIGYVMPSTLAGMYKYSYRMGNSLGDIKRKWPKLWERQVNRLSIADYGLFGLVGNELKELFNELTPMEKFIYIYSRIICAAGFFIGITAKRNSSLWEPLAETKVTY